MIDAETLKKGLIFLHGRLLQPSYPAIFGTVLRLRARYGKREIVAPAPFDLRILYQHQAIEGKDGYLFHRDNDAVDQLMGGIIFRERQVEVWIEALKERDAWCKANQAAMRMIIIPEKHVVYDDKLPGWLKISERRPALQLLDAVGDGLRTRLLYPAAALRDVRSKRPTFLKTDTHWTSYGAFIAYRALIESLGAEVSLESVEEIELQWTERQFIGDLGVRYERERSETILVAEPPTPYRMTFHNHNFGRGAVQVFETDRSDLPRCVLFRDSFSNALIPFLMRSFSRLVAISSLSCAYDVLQQEQPNVVLFAVIERFIASFGKNETIELPEDSKNVVYAALAGTDLSALGLPGRDLESSL